MKVSFIVAEIGKFQLSMISYLQRVHPMSCGRHPLAILDFVAMAPVVVAAAVEQIAVDLAAVELVAAANKFIILNLHSIISVSNFHSFFSLSLSHLYLIPAEFMIAN